LQAGLLIIDCHSGTSIIPRVGVLGAVKSKMRVACVDRRQTDAAA
jgi:hypothetical protein